MTQRFSLKRCWQEGETAIGAWCFAPHPIVTEAIARAGFDFVVIDMQHGLMDFETVLAMIQAVDLTTAAAVVRVPWNEPGIIGRVLDAGAHGVIVPMIDSVEDAQAAVKASRYPPLGRRSFGPLRVGMREGPDYFSRANSDIALLAMIETPGALDQCEEIAAMSGIDALFVGPFDLSVSLGLAPADNDGTKAFDDAMTRAVNAARAHGKAAGILSNADLAPRRISAGFQFITVFSDVPALIGSAAKDLARARAVQGGSQC